MAEKIVLTRESFNEHVLQATYEAQKMYNFEMGTGKHATWNNEADAFKHAYMQWYLTWRFNAAIAKFLGDMHENETPNAPKGERNMDLWNNAIGRETAQEMLVGYPDRLLDKSERMLFSVTDEQRELASKLIMKKMRAGELITHPSDKRDFNRMELERLKYSDRIFSSEEMDDMEDDEFYEHREMLVKQFLRDGDKYLTKSELDEMVQQGTVIYVESYVRADGTRVHGYYRRRSVR